MYSMRDVRRPRLTTIRADRQLLNLCRRNPKMPASCLHRLWRRHHGIKVSPRRMTKCPHLTVQHRIARLCWAREYKRLQLGHWRHVIFTDESHYILNHTNERQRVRQLRGENIRDDCIQEPTQAGGGSVMVWACIHYGGKTPLVVLDGNVNAVVYRAENHCFPHARQYRWVLHEVRFWDTRHRRLVSSCWFRRSV
uniref:Transposase Tc1-like domain-containing protein n=1 Tax=Seriola dumerili TaxID=41447 RepID=A0A3B4TJM9_SERDU